MNCSSDFKNFENSLNFKSFFRSLEQFFLQYVGTILVQTFTVLSLGRFLGSLIFMEAEGRIGIEGSTL